MDVENDSVRIENARINKIGLFYFGHGHVASIKAEIDGRGWGADITIPFDEIGKFMELFRDEKSISDDIEDGIYINRLNGTPVRVMFEGGRIFSHIIGIGDILADEDAEPSEFFMLK